MKSEALLFSRIGRIKIRKRKYAFAFNKVCVDIVMVNLSLTVGEKCVYLQRGGKPTWRIEAYSYLRRLPPCLALHIVRAHLPR